MKKIISFVMAWSLVICFAGFAAAGASKADAEGMVKKAIAFVKANGKERALAEFSNPKGQFAKGELYVYALDQKGVVIAHGANLKLIGKNIFDLKDPSGKQFIQEILKAPKSGGWVEYQWSNPVSKKIEHKIIYEQATGDMVLVCGVYK
jgi:signal transduction histidine kinase